MSADDPGSPDDPIGWELGTWEGARRAQLLAYRSLSPRDKLNAIEQMCDLTRRLAEARRRRGLRTSLDLAALQSGFTWQPSPSLASTSASSRFRCLHGRQ